MNLLSLSSVILIFSFFITTAVDCEEDRDCLEIYCTTPSEQRCINHSCVCVPDPREHINYL